MKFILNGFLLLSFSSIAFAAPHLYYEGTTTHPIKRNASASTLLKNTPSKQVTLLKLKFSEPLQKRIQANAKHALLKTSLNTKKLPSSVQIGMNNVPVLDQGLHGTCATFALIGALDALHGHDDYYSEVCSLNLGKTLAEHGYGESGWDGQMIKALLARVDEFGLVSKAKQETQGCGGATNYPVYDEDTSSAMSLEDFHALSEPFYYSGLNEWSTIFDITKWVSKNTSMDDILDQTKTSIYYGNRVLVGTLLPIMDGGSIGFLGQHHVPEDTLVLTPRIEQAIQLFTLEFTNWGGHAMIITGFDDNATAIDNEGRTHKGLLTLRNSWGSDAGDHGNYYMSYDYFKALVIELQTLIKVAP